MSEYPRPQRRQEWPAQPPRSTTGTGAQGRPGRDGYPQAGNGQAGYDDYGAGGYRQDSYGPAGYDDNAAGGYRQDRTGPVGGFAQEGYLRNGRLRRGSGTGVPRRRRRGWIALICTLAVLAVLLFIGDQVARAYMQNMIAGKLQTSADLPAKPSVTIEGFPFLTQLAARDIGTVDISASNVPAGKLDISSVKAKATGVHITSGFNGATIDRISGTALITFAELVSASGAHGITISADPKDGPDYATISFGPFSATAQVIKTGPSQITVKIGHLPSLAARLIGSLPDFVINVPKLPAGLQLQSVSVTGQGVSIEVAARHTSLSQ